ncbi:MAG TPA: glycosyltransferase family 4 protein [Polyangiaceae bacterium]
MKRARVLHVVVAGDIGGAERLLIDLATRGEASRAEHEVALFTPNRDLYTYLYDAGLKVHDRGKADENPFAFLWRTLGPADVAWLADLAKRRNVDVLHTHTFGSHVLGTRAAKRVGKPQLRTEHHVMHYFDPSTSAFTRWAATRTERFVAVSDYVKNVIVKAKPDVAARMTVVRNGVDTERWTPRDAKEKDHPFRAAVVCRLTAWKRVDLAITAAKKAGVELWIVGDGEERENLERFAKKNGASVVFKGFHSDTRALIAECDVTLSTAKEEPLGLSVLESLSMARPVVACATGGIPEIVVDEKTGFLARSDDEAGVADALSRAKARRADLYAMGAVGHKFAKKECSIEIMCRGYGDVYASMVEPA